MPSIPVTFADESDGSGNAADDDAIAIRMMEMLAHPEMMRCLLNTLTFVTRDKKGE